MERVEDREGKERKGDRERQREREIKSKRN